MLEDCGYEAGYDGLAEKNGGFYLMRLTRGDLLYRAQVPERLLDTHPARRHLTDGAPGRDSLGQHDYTWGAGWMYDVNGYYPGKGLSEWMLGDGDVLTLRFTLAWGKDIDGWRDGRRLRRAVQLLLCLARRAGDPAWPRLAGDGPCRADGDGGRLCGLCLHEVRRDAPRRPAEDRNGRPNGSHGSHRSPTDPPIQRIPQNPDGERKREEHVP